MRSGRTIATALALVLGAGACGEKAPSPAATQELGNRIEALRAEESGVLARTEELAREEVAVREARATLEARRIEIVRTGADPSQLEAEEQGLSAREQRLQEAQASLTRELEKVFRQYAEVTTTANASGGVARREASMAVREREIARREQLVAERETLMATRERELGKRERETCGAGTTTIVREVSGGTGTRWTRQEVEPILTKARRRMGEKGLLPADLPGQASRLEEEATRAMGQGDYGRAKLAADQLLLSVETLKVDRGFVSAKLGRLNASVKARPPSAAVRTEVDGLFRQATKDFADGKFPAANAALNRIAALVR